jgi:WhiB family transcriptional regulator, redox-sensing transcriptional regulator
MSLADLAHLIETPEWMHRAACRGLDSSMFFPGKSGANSVTKKAKQICQGCAVKPECLDWALAFPASNDSGIFGGTNSDERRRLRWARAS